MTVYMFDNDDEMWEAIQRGKEESRDNTSPAQWKLCDGEEHYAFYMEIDASGPILCVSRIVPRSELEAREDEECVDSYYGEGGVVSYGYLNCESWDTIYQPPGSFPDLHNRHASIMYEITKDEFDRFLELKLDQDACMQDPVTVVPMTFWFVDVHLKRVQDA